MQKRSLSKSAVRLCASAVAAMALAVPCAAQIQSAEQIEVELYVDSGWVGNPTRESGVEVERGKAHIGIRSFRGRTFSVPRLGDTRSSQVVLRRRSESPAGNKNNGGLAGRPPYGRGARWESIRRPGGPRGGAKAR